MHDQAFSLHLHTTENTLFISNYIILLSNLKTFFKKNSAKLKMLISKIEYFF